MPGGVDQDDLAAAVGEGRVDRVAGRARDVADDHPLFAEQGVDQARLADVRPADDRDRHRLVRVGGHRRVPAGGLGIGRPVGVLVVIGAVLVAERRSGADVGQDEARGHVALPLPGLDLACLAGDLLGRLGRQRPHDRVEQVARAPAVGGADREHLLPAEDVELGRLEVALLVVGLVDRDQDRRLRPAQEGGRLEVGRRRTAGRVDHQDDHVGLVDRQAGLLLDPLLDRVVGVDLQAAGVDHDEAPAVPFGVAVEAVAGGPGAVLDDRPAAAEDPVEQGALADVGPPDQGDDGQSGGHAQAAPAAIEGGSDVVRPAGVAARARAAIASSWASAAAAGRAGHLEDPLGHGLEVLDRGRGARR